MSISIGLSSKIAKNKAIYTAFLLYSITSNPIQCWAQSSDFSYTQITEQVVLETKNVESTNFVSILGDAIQKILVSPWFKDRLPEKFGIIVDGAWTKSAGYYSTSLKTQDGFPAILLEPKELDQYRTLPLLTHELTHLLHTHLRPQSDVKEESWIREGISMMAEWLVTGEYGLRKMNPSLNQAFKTPETSLIEPLDPNHESYQNVQKRTAQYGHILQYFLYIYRLCGKTELLNQLITSPSDKTGTALVDEVLKNLLHSSKACTSFKESFRMFSIARFKQDIAEEDYVYRTGANSEVRDAPMNLPPYSSGAYRLPSGKKCLAGEEPWGTSACIRIRFN